MMSFKGIFKYFIYICIAGWMFFLGIIVGRGSSPVTFDTQSFQKRLAAIAREFGEKKGGQEKIELSFYDVLDHPVPEEAVPPQVKPLEIIPKKETTGEDKIPVKTSRKKQTDNRQGKKGKPEIQVSETSNPDTLKPIKISAKSLSLKKNNGQDQSTDTQQKKDKEIPPVTDKKTGKYTIQIAAYKDFKDAVTQMAILEKKGFTAYRVVGQKDGITWYRVRMGSFESYEAAKQVRETLNKAKINSMIIKKGQG